VNDELMKDKPGKREAPLYWVGGIFLVVFAAYNLFEACRTEEILRLGRGKGAFTWISYHSSPNEFLIWVAINAIAFLFACVSMAISLRRKITGK
jgi:hypothetical protein